MRELQIKEELLLSLISNSNNKKSFFVDKIFLVKYFELIWFKENLI